MMLQLSIAIATLISSLFGNFLWANAALSPPSSGVPFFDLAKLQAGQKGTGYTVFSTVEGLETFDVVILGVMHNFLGPDRDLVIAKVEGERFKKSNIVAGMSGSPIYLDGQLLGALSFGFGDFSSQPIAGITPIKDMLRLGNEPKIPSELSSAFGPAKPIMMPLMAHGVSTKVVEAFGPKFQQFGLGPLLASASAIDDKNAIEEKLFVGGPIAAVVISGDLALSAMGTITYINDNRFLAFGHPFWSMGESRVPIASANIVATIFSERMAFKMGEPRKVIGHLTDDRTSGIAGVIGPPPKTTLMRVRLPNRIYQFSIAYHPTLVPMLVSFSLASALSGRLDNELGGTFRIKALVRFSNGQETQIERWFAGDGVALESIAPTAMSAELEMFLRQELEDVQIEKIDVDVERARTVEVARIVQVETAPKVLRSGSLSILVRLRPWQKKTKTNTIQMRLPLGIATGEYQLVVADRERSLDIERESGQLFQPASFSALLNQYTKLPKDNSLCVFLQKAGRRKQIQGAPALELTPSLRRLTAGIANPAEAEMSKASLPLGCVSMQHMVSGTAFHKLIVADE